MKPLLKKEKMKKIWILTAALAVGLLGLSVGVIGCNREPVARTDTEHRVDEALAGQVKTALGNSPAFKFPDVQVVAFKGKVQLSGFVVSEDQKRSAGAIAKSVPAVVAVENNISLKH